MTSDIGQLRQQQLAQLKDQAPAAWLLLQADPALLQQAGQVLLGSDFALRALSQEESLLGELHGSGDLAAARGPSGFDAAMAQLEAVTPLNEADLARALRRLRRREMLRILWRDISGVASTEQTLRETSWFAESAIAGATRMAARLLGARHGAPPGADAGLVVLGMGKLGGTELNFSSDVDLIFLFAQGGDTTGPAVLPLEEFYTRQGRLVIRLLDAATEEGFVFRVDMRLRPFGDSGPLVASFAFFEDYLQSHGRDWERYAYVKARALTGAAAFEAVRRDALRPFVFRRYLDFGVFEALREMKALISRDVQRREQAENLKLGAGGIREIEFIVQAFQLVRGGQDGALRQPSLLTVLPRLAGARLLPPEVVAELSAAYDFLRRLENRVQMFNDAQTHALPGDALQLRRISAALDFDAPAALLEQLAEHRRVVAGHFAALFADAGAPAQSSGRIDLAPLWESGLDRGLLLEQLATVSSDPSELLEQLVQLCGSSRLRQLDEPGRKRLKLLLELLLVEQQAARNPDALRRIFSILEAIGQRSAYFSLLVEHRTARARLTEVAGYGDFLATQLARSPALLDELIDERWVQSLPDRATLEADLDQRLEEVNEEDVDREVETMCRFKQAAVFRVALADLSGRLPLMSVSDRLTEIAEIIVECALQSAWRQMTAQLGTPRYLDEGGLQQMVRLAALGYGKFGGYELGYASDLDLVFLHDSRGATQETDRAAPVDNQVFFLRFAQRLIHLLTMHSAAGRLYEVDVRLRPSGKGGMLVTSIDAFRRYQFEEAWTWEHQALLHARTVAGDAGLRERIEVLRLEVLGNAVRRTDLREKVAEMRERMRRELSAAQPGQFDLKQDRGGMADIEFLAQYWALRWADAYPPVAHFPDTIRQLESVASAALVPQQTVDQLVAAYQRYRQTAHRRSLEGLSGVLDAGEFEAERTAVAGIWRATMDESV
ncbi:MAG TPA: bifunctional [glutamate--ammonia ligase]-adenylyl-L-tyrosine phosphorylase/[glutamate--ammonia-ligase] adenylyltransferase [Steroidobacteraceae bacterium]|nr:bifunctional [glutamate--ammonia ligase]-adenylyl-L-tyrosine phosphorylase/[glutamate--ammonia-ligase] adenylyltransferase [Steroidobacteraceae bacterium]